MALCECLSRQKVRKKREGPYQKVNAYTQPLACEQIVTFLLFLIHLVLHCIFVVPALPAIGSSVLWVMLGYFLLSVLLIGYDYVHLTTFDPVDQLIVQKELAEKYQPDELKFCLWCDSEVHRNSHHCSSCNRCSQNFDHHCRFLNNCIGGRNYESFIRLLCVYSLYLADGAAMAVWTAVKTFEDSSLSFSGSGYGMVVSAGLALVILVAVGSLLVFHCYITCCEGISTLQLIKGRPSARAETPNDEGLPGSERRFSARDRFT